MVRYAITNQKGGSCKTTTAVNLAACLAEKGKRILVIDLDPQASASKWFGIQDSGKGLLDVFEETADITSLIRNTHVKNVSIIPSSAWNAHVDRNFSNEPGAEVILREAMKGLPDYDFLFFDCPPGLSLLGFSALTAADRVLVPVEASFMALEGMAALVETVNMIKRRLNKELILSEILACRVSRTVIVRDVLTSLKKAFPDQVMKAEIRENTKLKEAPSHRQPITVYDPQSIGADDYSAAAKELLGRLR